MFDDHGNPHTYTNHACRCEACVEAHRALIREQRRRRFELRVEVNGRLIAPVEEERHGKVSTYQNWGCRCELCVDANAAKRQEQRDRGIAA